MFKTEAANENTYRLPYERFGLRQPIRGFKQLRQIVQVCSDVGMVVIKLFSSMASARSKSGSASARRSWL